MCDFFGQPLDRIRGKARYRSVVMPRQIIMFLLRRYTKLSYKDIGRLYNRDHTTAIHSMATVLNHMEMEPEFRKEIVYLEAQIQKDIA